MAVSIFSKDKLIFSELFHRRRRWSYFFRFILQNFYIFRKSFVKIEAENDYWNKIVSSLVLLVLFIRLCIDVIVKIKSEKK